MDEPSSDMEDSEADKNVSSSAKLSVPLSGVETITYSLKNSSLNSKQIKKRDLQIAIRDLERSIGKPSSKDQKAMVALMGLRRLAGTDFRNITNIARTVILNELKINVSRDLPEMAKLELGLTAVQKKNFPMAEHWFNTLSRSKNKKILAAIATGRGMIELLSDRLPEAIFYWNKALKIIPNYRPARLNIGFYALKFGDALTAKKMFSGMSGDWFALTGTMQAERLSGNFSKVDSLCARLLEEKKSYKPAVFSCALHTLQGKGDAGAALTQFKGLSKLSGPPESINEIVDQYLNKLEIQKTRTKK